MPVNQSSQTGDLLGMVIHILYFGGVVLNMIIRQSPSGIHATPSGLFLEFKQYTCASNTGKLDLERPVRPRTIVTPESLIFTLFLW